MFSEMRGHGVELSGLAYPENKIYTHLKVYRISSQAGCTSTYMLMAAYIHITVQYSMKL